MFSSPFLYRKNALEGRRVAYFGKTMNDSHPHYKNSPVTFLGALASILILKHPLDFHFYRKSHKPEKGEKLMFFLFFQWIMILSKLLSIPMGFAREKLILPDLLGQA